MAKCYLCSRQNPSLLRYQSRGSSTMFWEHSTTSSLLQRIQKPNPPLLMMMMMMDYTNPNSKRFNKAKMVMMKVWIDISLNL